MPKGKLSGALKMRQWAIQGCVRQYAGRKSQKFGRRGGYGDQLETCTKAVDEVVEVMASGKAMYFSEAVDIVAKRCTAMRDVDQQTACLTGATEALLKSKGQTASLDGRRKKRRRT